LFVVDDGSEDDTSEVAKAAGANVIRHSKNLGKGAALRTGLMVAFAAGCDTAVTIDADGQHPATEAWRVLEASADPAALVLGVRDLAADGAPSANRVSNAISNMFLSLFSRRWLHDTQCGLRRYPLPRTLELGGIDNGYAYEAEIVLLAIAAHVALVELPIRVVYPPPAKGTTHFHRVRDPARIIRRVLCTLWSTRALTHLAESSFPGRSGVRGPGGALDIADVGQ
jgi:glycosyltransferase involved in cell wall biosynthesis